MTEQQLEKAKRDVELHGSTVLDALAAYWARGEVPSQRELSADAFEASEGHNDPRVGRCLRYWSHEGMLETQKSGNGRDGAPRVLNLTSREVEETTLTHVVDPFLERKNVSDYVRRQVRSAMRMLFDLKTRCPDDDIVAAAHQMDASSLHALGEDIHDRAVAEGKAERTAKNLRTSVRKALRTEAKARNVPMVFPRVWLHPQWQEAKNRYLPVDGGPIGDADLTGSLRALWERYHEICAGLFPERGDAPSAITQDMAEEAIREMMGRRGRRTGNRLRCLLRNIARHFGEGPYTNVVSHQPGVKGQQGVTNGVNLVRPSGESVRTYEGFLAVFDEHGFSAEWREFFEWYEQYSTVPFEELRDGTGRFPTSRPAARELKQQSLMSRTNGVRAYLGVAVNRLGMDPAEMRLHEVFGFKAWDEIIAETYRWWKKRYRGGEVSWKYSSGLKDIVIHSGLIAEALYVRLRHQRNREVSGLGENRRAARTGAVRREEMQGDLTAEELALLRSYEASGDHGTHITSEMERAPKGHAETTMKDLRELVHETPHTWYIRLHEGALERVQRMKRRGEDGDEEYHTWVHYTYALGMLMSTGVRLSGLTHVRLDEQYGQRQREQRVVELRAVDRKNKRSHSARVVEKYVPDWLEEEYLERSRPFFLERFREETGTDHPWLFVKPDGSPWGCLGEDEDAAGRDAAGWEIRKSQFRRTWQCRLTTLAFDLDLDVPIEPGHFTPHCVRNVFGYAFYQGQGEMAAANYLGDDPSSVRGHYGEVSGVEVDAGTLAEGFGEVGSLGTDPATSSGGRKPGSYASMLRDLVDMRRQGEISDEEFQRAKADLNECQA